MACLVCDKSIPSLRQLAGSQFCSEEHSQQHAASQRGAYPKLAWFALPLPEVALVDGLPDTRTIQNPIPRFCELILSRVLKAPDTTTGLKGAKTISWIPGEDAPETACVSGPDAPETWARLSLDSPGAPVLPALECTLAGSNTEPAADVMRPADFVLDGDPLAAVSGLSGSLYVACDFPLCPVWLPALFDEIGGLRATPRAWTIPAPTLAPVSLYEDYLEAAGPGFSGVLACPTLGEVCWEFLETWTPEREVEPAAPPAPQKPSDSFPVQARGFWRQTPALARGMALVIPLLAPAWFYAPWIRSQVSSADSSPWMEAIQARAIVDLEDDFRAGFGSWTGKPGWEKTWSRDGAGSAQPGRLALYRDTIPLTNYRLEFQGQVLTRALSFVLRAADTSNYQAVKIVVTKSGPLASIALLRYPVIQGREGPKTQVPIPLTASSDTLYKLLVSVEGDHFSVTVNGQFGDAWSDSRLKSGGIGFFAEKGEAARLRSVHVIDKDDFLGRLCYQVSRWTADRRTIGAVKHE